MFYAAQLVSRDGPLQVGSGLPVLAPAIRVSPANAMRMHHRTPWHSWGATPPHDHAWLGAGERHALPPAARLCASHYHPLRESITVSDHGRSLRCCGLPLRSTGSSAASWWTAPPSPWWWTPSWTPTRRPASSAGEQGQEQAEGPGS